MNRINKSFSLRRYVTWSPRLLSWVSASSLFSFVLSITTALPSLLQMLTTVYNLFPELSITVFLAFFPPWRPWSSISGRQRWPPSRYFFFIWNSRGDSYQHSDRGHVQTRSRNCYPSESLLACALFPACFQSIFVFQSRFSNTVCLSRLNWSKSSRNPGRLVRLVIAIPLYLVATFAHVLPTQQKCSQALIDQ